MRNLTIKMRLIIFSFIVSAMMAMVGGIGWWGVKSLSDSIDTIYLGSVDSIYGLEIILTTYKNDIIFAVEKVHNKNSEQEKTIQNIVLAREKIENHWKEYLKTRLSPEQRGMIEQINIKMNMVNSFLDKLLDTIKLHDESQLIESIINTMYSSLDPVLLIFEK